MIVGWPFSVSDRIRRGGAHHQHVVVGVDVRRRDRGSRAGVAVDELDLLTDDEIGDGDRLFRIAGVVLDDDLDLAPVDAAGVVDRGGRGLRAPLHLFADRGDRAGHRSGDGDRDVLSAGRRGQRRQGAPCQRQKHKSAHVWLPPWTKGGCPASERRRRSGAAGAWRSGERRRWQPPPPSPAQFIGPSPDRSTSTASSASAAPRARSRLARRTRNPRARRSAAPARWPRSLRVRHAPANAAWPRRGARARAPNPARKARRKADRDAPVFGSMVTKPAGAPSASRPTTIAAPSARSARKWSSSQLRRASKSMAKPVSRQAATQRSISAGRSASTKSRKGRAEALTARSA